MALLKANTGIGTTNPTSALHVIGDVLVTGVVTATTFNGQVNSGVSTITNFNSTNANITNINSTGIATLGIVTANQLFVTGVSTFVGIVTNRSTIFATQLSVAGVSTFNNNVRLLDNNTLSLGDSDDLQIVHDGSDSFIKDTGTGSLIVNTNKLEVKNAANNETGLVFNQDGAVELYFDNSKRLETTGIGVSLIEVLNGTATLTGPSTIIIDPAVVGDNTGVVRIKGDLYVDGTEFVVNSTTIELADLRVGIATTVGTNLLLDGGGIGIGSTNIRKTFTYNFTSDSLKSSEHLDLASGKVYKIDGTEVLSATQLTVANINAVGISTIGIASISQLLVTGVSTFTGLVDANGGATIDNIQIGITNDNTIDTTTGGLTLDSNSGTITINDQVVVTGVSTFNNNVDLDQALNVDGNVTVIGVSTFTGLVDANGGATIDNVRIGVAGDNEIDTSTGNLTIDSAGGTVTIDDQLVVSGIATFNNNVDLDQALNVDGNVTVTGLSTFVGVGTFINDLYVGGDLYIKDDLVFDELTARNAVLTGNLSVAGVSTFVNGPVLLQNSSLGIGTTNPTSSLWVGGDGYFTGDAYVSGNLGIGTTNPQAKLHSYGIDDTLSTVLGAPTNTLIEVNNDTPWSIGFRRTDLGPTADVAAYIDNNRNFFIGNGLPDGGFRYSVGLHTEYVKLYAYDQERFSTLGVGATVTGTLFANQLSVSGISTFVGLVDANGGATIDNIQIGITNDNTIDTSTGGLTLDSSSGTVTINDQLVVTGVSTFNNNVDLDQALNVDGNITVTGLSTFVGVGTFSNDLYVGGDLYVKDDLFLDELITRNINVTGVGTIATLNSTFATLTNINSSGITTLGIVTAGQIFVSGVTTSTGGFVGALTGIAASATKLVTPRTISISGDVVGSTTFDGTQNVSIAATIQPNSVALKTDTTGDYVESISGTSNQITVTGGTGEGSTPTLSFPNQVTIPQDLTVLRDVQIDRDLNVNGNITIGGTSGILFTETLKISDSDLVLGFRTDAFGNDVSNDTTANHGGIAVASTEGNPLVNFNIAGIETLPPTYKKIMWFKAGEFAGLGTDAWLFNYAVGIGSTQFPNGTRLAAGSVQFTENDLAVVRDINASGIITAATGKITTLNSTNANILTGIVTSISGTNLNYTGVGTVNVLRATTLNVSGVSTFVGVGTFSNDLYVGGDLYVADDLVIDELNSRNINVTGVGTVVNLNSTTANITTGYIVTGVVTSISGTNLNYTGVGTIANLNVSSTSTLALANATTLNVTGITTLASAGGITTTGGDFYVGGDLYIKDDLVFDELTARNAVLSGNLSVSGISTFTGAIDANGDLDVDGHTELDNVNISGVTTFSGLLDANGGADISGQVTLNNTLSVIGVSTFTGLIDANGGAEIDNIRIGVADNNTIDTSTGNLTLDSNGGTVNITDQLNVSGVSTFQTNVNIKDNASLYLGDDNDLRIYHNGSNSFIQDIGTGNLFIDASNTYYRATSHFIQNSSSSENLAVFTSNGSVELYYDNIKTFETTGYGATVFGTLQSQQLNVTGVSTFTNGPVLIGSGTSTGTVDQKLQVTGGAYVSGNLGIGINNPISKLDVNGDVNIRKSTDTNGYLSIDGDTNVYVNLTATNAIISADSNLILNTNSSEKLRINSTGNLGIGTINPTSRLDVVGDVKITGVVTATTFNGQINAGVGTITTLSGTTATYTTGNFTNANVVTGIITNISGTNLNYTGVGTIATLNSTTGTITNLSGNNLNYTGVATITTLNAVTVTNTNINATGVITATQFSTGANGIGINTDTISGPAIIYIDPAAVGDNTGAVRIKGDFYVDGTQTIINSQTIDLADFRIGIGTTATNDIILDGAGIGIGSASNQKTFVWNNTSSSLKSSENLDLASGKTYKINGTDVLSSTTLGSGVVNSSLTSVGTLGQLNVSGITTTSRFNVGTGGTVITTTLGPSRVGINSVSPAYTLDVNGDVNFNGTLYNNGIKYVSGVGIYSGGNIISGAGTTIINFVGSAVSTIVTNSTTGITTVTLERGAFNRTTTSFTATSGQTTFSLNYTPGYIDVYVNGVRLTATEYVATNGTSVAILTGCFAGDIVDITVFADAGLFSSSKWSPGNGNDIYRFNGNIGLGTDKPTARLDINGVLALETTVTAISTTTATTIDSASSSAFRSIRYQVQITQGSSYQSTDLMAIHDGTTASLIEYGSIATGDYLCSFDSLISGGSLLLQTTMSSASSATVKVARYGITL